jgi:rare lipoprotein A
MGVFAVLLALLVAVGAGSSPAAAAEPVAVKQTGKASWYRAHRGPTASGVRHDADDLSAAHPRLPFGSKVRVTNLRNGRSVVVAITDRGPFGGGRIIDVSEAAAAELGFKRAGTAQVRIELAGR